MRGDLGRQRRFQSKAILVKLGCEMIRNTRKLDF